MLPVGSTSVVSEASPSPLPPPSLRVARGPLTIAWWVAAALTLTCASGAVRAAEPPPEPAALDYWPRQPGATWIYQNAQGRQSVVRVAGETTLDDRTVTVIERGSAAGPEVFRTYYAVEDGAVLLVATEAPPGKPGAGLQRLSPARLEYPAQLARGQPWEVLPGRAGLMTKSVRGEETVTVPAGTYRAVVVVTNLEQDGVTTEWLAPQVGLVRKVATIPKGAHSTWELVRFTTAAAAAAQTTPPRASGQ